MLHPFYNQVKQIIFSINRIIEKICIALLCIILLSILLSVIFRYVFLLPLFWTDEISRMAFIWLVFLGSVLAVEQKRNFTVTFIYDKLSTLSNTKINKIIIFVKYFVIIIFLLYLFCEGILFYLKTGGVITAGLGIPINFFYLIIPISAILIFLNLLI